MAVLCVCFSCLAGTPVTRAEQPETAQTAALDELTENNGHDSGYELVAENRRFALSMNNSTYEVSLSDRETGEVWYSNPQDRAEDPLAFGINQENLSSAFTMVYRDKSRGTIEVINSYAGSVQNREIKVEKEEDGFKIYYKFSSIKCIVPLRYRLEEDGLSCSILTDEIIEAGECSIMSISLLPFFGAGSVKDTGYLMVPDGSGALIYFNNGKHIYEKYSEKVYGRDENFDVTEDNERKQSIRLPVFGIQKNSRALLGIITQGEALASIEASVSGESHSYNQVNANFELRAIDRYMMGVSGNNPRVVTIYEETPISKGELTVKYCPLSGEQSGYSGMALKYRSFLMARHGLQYKPTGQPLCLEALGAVRLKESFLGFLVNRTVPLTRFDELSEMLQELNERGVDSVAVKYTDWNKDKINGRVVDDAAVVGKIGGKSGLNKLLNGLRNQGATLFLDTDYYKVRRWNGLYSKTRTAAKTVANRPVYKYRYSFLDNLKDPNLPASFLIAPKEVERIAERFIKSFNKLGDVQISLGDMTAFVQSDFGIDGWSRQKSADAIQKAVALLSEGRSLMIKGGNAYALPYADIVIDAPDRSSRFDITDESVPFYQLAVSGLATYSYKPLNLSGEPKKLFLKSVETGAALHFIWLGKDRARLNQPEYSKYYSVDPLDWYQTAADYYQKLKEIHLLTEGSALVSHRRVQDNVFETVWENGCTVLTNYNKEDVRIGDTTVAAESYALIK